MTAATLLLTLLVQVAWSQCSYTLSGQVRTTSGESLPGASLILQPGQRGVVTDANGNFRIPALCAGIYQLTIQFVGYKTLQQPIVLDGNSEHVFTLEADVTQLNEVIVEDHAQYIDHAKNFSVLTEKQLAATAGKTLGESLREVPGVNTIQAGPGIFKPVIHGVHSQRVLILNYGIRQEGQQWGAEHAPEIDPFMASNIIVIKDASSIKYGTDAIGGVIVVNPAPLPEAPGLGGSINTVMQSNGRSGVMSGMIEGGVKNHTGWGWRAQGTVKRAGDFHTPTYSLTNTGIREYDFSLATGYQGKRYGMELFFSHFQSTIGILKGTSITTLEDLEHALEREPPQYTTGFSYHIGAPRQAVSHNLLKVNMHRDLAHGQLRLQYGLQQNNRREYDIRRSNLAGVPSIDLQLYTHTLETEWERVAANNNSLCVGVTGMFQDNANRYGTKRVPFIPNFRTAAGGLYGVTRVIRHAWTFDAGARYDFRYYQVAGYDFKNTLYQNDLVFHNVSATAGASVKINPRETLSMSLNNAWRPPHVAELYSLGTHQSAAAIEYGLLLNDTTNEVMDIHAVSFKNEQALKWVSTYAHHTPAFTWEVTGYVNYIFNYIYLKPTGVTRNPRGTYPYFRYTQTDALLMGLDAFVSRALTKHVTTSARASVLRASDQTNHDYLVFIPPNRYDIAVRYEGSWKDRATAFAEVKVLYVAHQSRAPRVITPRQFREATEQGTDPLQGSTAAFDFMKAPPGYMLVSISTGLSATINKRKYDLRLGADNLFNKSYREYTNRFRYYTDEIGRNITLSLKCTF